MASGRPARFASARSGLRAPMSAPPSSLPTGITAPPSQAGIPGQSGTPKLTARSASRTPVSAKLLSTQVAAIAGSSPVAMRDEAPLSDVPKSPIRRGSWPCPTSQSHAPSRSAYSLPPRAE